MVRISIIIPTCDRPGPLLDCLEAMASAFPDDAETIVVSDGGTEPLEPYLAPFVELLRLRCVAVKRGGPSAARNRGLAAARGNIVLFTDDDCRPQPGWINALASGVSFWPPRAAGGRTLNGISSNPYAEVAQVILDLIGRYEISTRGEPSFFPSNNLAFPTDALRSMGGFDESFRTAEDRELCRRWRFAGLGFNNVPAAVVAHDPQLNFGGFMRRCFAYGRGAARFHTSGGNGSFWAAVLFHFRLPLLARNEVVARGLRGGARLIGLLLLWEVANLAGYVAAFSSKVRISPRSVRPDSVRRTE